MINESQQALLFKEGKFVSQLGSGRHRFWGRSLDIVVFDIRQSSLLVGGQEVTTLDGASIRLSVIVTCNIVDPLALYRKLPVDSAYTAVVANAASWPINNEVQIQVRDWIGTRPLQEVLDNRTSLGAAILEPVQAVALMYGIQVESTRLLDFNLTGSLKSAQADVIKAELEGKAAMQRARNEAATLRSLINSAKLTQDHPGLLELRILASGQKPRVTFMVGHPEGNKQVAAEESSE